MRYASVTTWAEYFEKHEGVKISDVTIRSKLGEAGKIGIDGRDKMGRVFRKAYYYEADVRAACADLLRDLPQADENGFFIEDGERYGTIGAWGRKLPISTPTIQSRLQKSDAPSIEGKDGRGQITPFYCESDVLAACADLLEDLPQVDESGFFEKDDQKFGTIPAWSRALELDIKTINRCLKQLLKKGIEGKDSLGHIWTFYSESDVREACDSYLDKNVVQANEDGFFEMNKRPYGTPESWSRIYHVRANTIMSRLIKGKIKGVKGRTKKGRITIFYSDSDLLTCISDLLEDLPQAGEDGFFESGGEKYGFVYAWSKALLISKTTILSRLKKFETQGVKGKNRRGQIFDFYSESEVRAACADILAKKEKANPKHS